MQPQHDEHNYRPHGRDKHQSCFAAVGEGCSCSGRKGAHLTRQKKTDFKSRLKSSLELGGYREGSQMVGRTWLRCLALEEEEVPLE